MVAHAAVSQVNGAHAVVIAIGQLPAPSQTAAAVATPAEHDAVRQLTVASGKAHREATGSCLFCDVVEEELRDGRRVIWENTCWVAFVPFYARWPYEVHVYAKAHVLSLANLTEDERYALAEALKAVLLKYDNLWNFSMPYLMAVHQAPCGDIDASSFHLHVEFYPPHRTPVEQ